MNNILTLLLVIISAAAWSQTNAITISAGYAFATIDGNYIYPPEDTPGKGYRINVLYEYIPKDKHIAWGFIIGYANIIVTTSYLNNKIESSTGIVPMVLAPKLLIGNGKYRGFIKFAAGIQFSGVETVNGPIPIEAEGQGFILGLGAGAMVDLNEKIFLNIEYELDWMDHGYFAGGWLNAAMFGIGRKF